MWGGLSPEASRAKAITRNGSVRASSFTEAVVTMPIDEAGEGWSRQKIHQLCTRRFADTYGRLREKCRKTAKVTVRQINIILHRFKPRSSSWFPEQWALFNWTILIYYGKVKVLRYLPDSCLAFSRRLVKICKVAGWKSWDYLAEFQSAMA